MQIKWIIVGVIVLVVLMLAIKPLRFFHKYYLSPCAANGPEKQNDFEIYLEEVNLKDYSKSIEQFGANFDIKIIQEINYKNKSYPIYQINYNKGASQNRLLLFAATHGNEFASALVIPELLSEIAENKIYDSWNIRIITPINPVGLDYQSRYNENGCDINRDFKDFKTVGAQIQKNAIHEFKPDIIISLHEGLQKGFFIIGTSSIDRELESTIIEALKEEQLPITSKIAFGIPLLRKGVMHEGGFIKMAKKLFRIHTLGPYAESQGTSVITTESSWLETDIQKRIKPHIVTIRTVVKEFKK